MKKWKYSIADHELMDRFELNANEALYLDMVTKMQGNPKAHRPGWCNAPNVFFAQALRITDRTIRAMTKRLVEIGLLEVSPEKGEANAKRTTALYYYEGEAKEAPRKIFPTTPENISAHPGKNFRTPPENISAHIVIDSKENKECEDNAPTLAETNEQPFDASAAIAEKMLNSTQHLNVALMKLTPELHRPAVEDLPKFGAWWLSKNAATYSDAELRDYVKRLNPANLWARWGAAWAPNLKPAGQSRFKQPEPPRPARPVFI